MALTTAQQVRLRIQDAPRLADSTYYADGKAAEFLLPHSNITSASAYVTVSNGQWSATGATFNVSGRVAFSGAISANSAYRTTYVYSTFSDDEIGHFTAVGGNVAGAAREAARTLLFDSLKRSKWAAPDGTTYDDTAAMAQLYRLIEQLDEEIAGGDIESGGFVSWAEGQGDW